MKQSNSTAISKKGLGRRVLTLIASCMVYSLVLLAIFFVKPADLKIKENHIAAINLAAISPPAEVKSAKPVVDKKTLEKVKEKEQKKQKITQYRPSQRPEIIPIPQIANPRSYDPYLPPSDAPINNSPTPLNTAQNTPIAHDEPKETIKPTEIVEIKEAAQSQQSKPAINNAQQASIKQKYIDRVINKVENNKTYPAVARNMGLEGTAIIMFRLDKNGRLISAKIIKSSGKKILDDAAIMAVKDAASFDKFPAELTIEYLNIETPIEFNLKV